MKKIVLIDGNSLMYRAYYALAYTGNLMKNSQGVFTNATYAFINMMNAILNSNFDNILVAFDASKQTFRHAFYEEYKGGRSPMPDEMRCQIPYIKKYLDLVGVKRYELKMYEADDIIGTMARRAEAEGYQVDIYSSDRDLLQLITNHTRVRINRKGLSDIEDFDIHHFKEIYGLVPSQMIDLKALMGDSSDNLKGIAGVGEKTALKLVSQYESVEKIIENADQIGGKMGEKIKNGVEDALLCKKMVTIDCDSPLEIGLEDTLKKDEQIDELTALYQELEFNSFLKKRPTTKKNEKYQIITENVKDVLIDKTSVYMEMLEENYHLGKIVGFGLSNKKGHFFLEPEIIENPDFIAFLEDEQIEKYTYDFKRMMVVLKYHNINIKGVSFDLLLASYIVNNKITKDDFKAVAMCYGYDGVAYDEEIYNKGAKLGLPDKPIFQAHVVNKAIAIEKLKEEVYEKLTSYDQLALFTDIELPLASVLGDMEYLGIKIDQDELLSQRKEMGKKIVELEDKIFAIVGHEFNISSPKQLADILFGELNLPIIKKTKTGYSTDSDVLEALAEQHELPGVILEYRQITKLYSTYIEGIKNVIMADGCVHTIFKQALTETGRLSSIEPNLQNIPIRRSDGAMIRKMFVPKQDYIMSMDYSQIELRILAHMADVKKMKEDFNNNLDIHEETAKAIFHKDSVDKNERRAAKAVNFGIVYGISAWGLAKDINIGAKEAQVFIDEYLEHYHEIKNFMDDIKQKAKEDGYVKTLMNRRRYFPEINSPVYAVREFAKRTAMNAPIQGSAADVIKKAMVDIYRELNKRGLKSKLIIQVHDELIFDCPKEEIEIMNELVKEVMENAVCLSVKLTVDGGYGKTWYEAK